ncbi:hypothetical protein Lepto7376_0128 [[Leptolyngbya] sp. PCC 7376]|uniref:hypothetical protein n=1 Tax=[Leptolyngbya] sp. PCC 7376 TaxID=111781 RepID=UPI00029EC680|nr:hypothetical protein [[Leptolyngbya] sp. PCC 7376]AFY36576.1 hypothetical protein Lepto7376_0128 [[Leptolyngbya] sp. PCC 7376]
MQKWSNHLITVFAVGAAIQVASAPAIAQTHLEGRHPNYPEHTADAFDRAVSYELRDTDTSFDTWQVLNEYFGVFPLSLTQPAYPEHQAKRDYKKVDLLYRDVMLQQVASDPVIRTPDLANPFNSSIRSEAPAQNGTLQLLRGTDFSFDR